MNDWDYIEIAARVAIAADDVADPRNFRLGAVGVRGSDGALVFARNGAVRLGHENSESQRRQLTVSAHAECRAAKKLTPGSTLYVARASKSLKKLGLAKPCRSCLTYCTSRGITRIVYSVNEHTIAEVRI